MARRDVRRAMIDGAVELLATRGLEGTSFAEVLKTSGASRGSTYHHFPGGKDELISAALDRAEQVASVAVGHTAGATPADVLERFVDMWRRLLVGTDLRAGCAVVAVTVATDSDDLRAQAGRIFGEWRTKLADALSNGGLDPDRAASLAAMAIASCEGAVALARAEGSMQPFDLVATELIALARSMTNG